MHRRISIALLAIGLLAALLSARSTAAQGAGPCLPERCGCADGRFLESWNGSGGRPVFSFAISQQRAAQGNEGIFVTQGYERARFELHPANASPSDVLLGRLGDELLRR